MPEVKIYTIDGCHYCKKAKEILTLKKVKFSEIKVITDEYWKKLEKLTSRETVPQIFINGRHIGSCDDLLKLDKEKKLDLLLKKIHNKFINN